MEQQIFGVDHGNGNIKTALTVFPCGYTEQSVKPAGIFGKDVIQYQGKYYVLNTERFPYTTDKTGDERCFILTLFAIAKEVRARMERRGQDWKTFKGFKDREIILAAGLPPAHFEKLQGRFRKYFMERAENGVKFTYNDKPFSFRITRTKLYPQDYSAAVILRQETVQKYRTVYCIDIGDGTVDLLGMDGGVPDKGVMASRELGMAVLKAKIIDGVINDYAYTLDARTIEDVLTPQAATVLDYDITERIRMETAEWADRITNELHKKVPDFRIAPTIFVGGGSEFLKPYLVSGGMFGITEFIPEINANAIGYETIAGLEFGSR